MATAQIADIERWTLKMLRLIRLSLVLAGPEVTRSLVDHAIYKLEEPRQDEQGQNE